MGLRAKDHLAEGHSSFINALTSASVVKLLNLAPAQSWNDV